MIAVVFLQPPEIHCLCSVRKTLPVSSPNFAPVSLEIMMNVLAFLDPGFRTVAPGGGKNKRVSKRYIILCHINDSMNPNVNKLLEHIVSGKRCWPYPMFTGPEKQFSMVLLF